MEVLNCEECGQRYLPRYAKGVCSLCGNKVRKEEGAISSLMSMMSRAFSLGRSSGSQDSASQDSRQSPPASTLDQAGEGENKPASVAVSKIEEETPVASKLNEAGVGESEPCSSVAIANIDEGTSVASNLHDADGAESEASSSYHSFEESVQERSATDMWKMPTAEIAAAPPVSDEPEEKEQSPPISGGRSDGAPKRRRRGFVMTSPEEQRAERARRYDCWQARLADEAAKRSGQTSSFAQALASAPEADTPADDGEEEKKKKETAVKKKAKDKGKAREISPNPPSAYVAGGPEENPELPKIPKPDLEIDPKVLADARRKHKAREESIFRQLIENAPPTMELEARTFQVGFTRRKYCGNEICEIEKCQGFHATRLHEACKDLWETWRAAGEPGQLCANQCQYPRGHLAENCGMGTFRDHPDNPKLPEEYKELVRPWPANDKMLPFNMHWLRPDIYPEKPKRLDWAPDLPMGLECGLPGGLCDTRPNVQAGMNRSCARYYQKYLRYQEIEYVPENPEGPAKRPVDGPGNVLHTSTAAALPLQESKKDLEPEHAAFQQWPKGLPKPGYTPWESEQWFEDEFTSRMNQLLSVEDKDDVVALKERWQDDYNKFLKAKKNSAFKESVIDTLLEAWRVYMSYLKWYVPGDVGLPSGFFKMIEAKGHTWKRPLTAASNRAVVKVVQDPEYPHTAWDEEEELEEAEDGKHPRYMPQNTVEIYYHLRNWVEMFERALSKKRRDDFTEWWSNSTTESLKAIDKWATDNKKSGADMAVMTGHMDSLETQTTILFTTLEEIADSMNVELIDENTGIEKFQEFKKLIDLAFDAYDTGVRQELQALHETDVRGFLEEASYGRMDTNVLNVLQGRLLPRVSDHDSILKWIGMPLTFDSWLIRHNKKESDKKKDSDDGDDGGEGPSS